MYGTKVQTKHFYEPATIETWGTDDDEVAKAQFEVYLSSEHYQPAEPTSEVVEAITELAKSHELHLVTGRAEERDTETRELLNRWFSGCFASVEYTNHFV